MALSNVVTFLLFVYFIRMLRRDNQQPTTTITPIPPTQPPPPPPSIVGPQNPFQQNPSAPGGGVIIGPGTGIGQGGGTMPIHSTLTYLFPVAAETAKASFIDTVDHAAHGDYPTKKDVKQGFINDYTYALPIEENLTYRGHKGVAKKAFSHRLDTWMDDVMGFFY